MFSDYFSSSSSKICLSFLLGLVSWSFFFILVPSSSHQNETRTGHSFLNFGNGESRNARAGDLPDTARSVKSSVVLEAALEAEKGDAVKTIITTNAETQTTSETRQHSHEKVSNPLSSIGRSEHKTHSDKITHHSGPTLQPVMSATSSSSDHNHREEVQSLSISALKKALKGLQIDDSDCVEKSDLQNKLLAALQGKTPAEVEAALKGNAAVVKGVDLSQKPSMTHRSHNGNRLINYDDDALLIGNTKNPTHLVTLVHGLGDSANGWRQPAQMLASALPHVLFVLPTAPQQPVTINGGMSMNAWFDIVSLGGEATMTPEQIAARPQDPSGVLASAKFLAHLAGHIAFKHKIPTRNIIFGGFSQGAAVSIAAALTAPYVPRAVMPLSGFFPAAKEAIAIAKESGQIDALVANKVPFRFFHGDSDQMLPLGLARLGADALKAEGLSSIEFQVYKGLPHSTSNEELRDIASWLKTITS